jgi:hypothetical protein
VIISEIERDMNNRDDDGDESNPESIAPSEFTVNQPDASLNHLPLALSDNLQVNLGGAFVPVHTTYTSNNQRPQDRPSRQMQPEVRQALPEAR